MAQTRNRHVDVNLNLNVRGMSPSATVASNEQANALRRQGRRIFKLGLGQSPFPVPAAVVEDLKTHAHEKDYLPVKGLAELREAVAAYHRRTQNTPGTEEDVMIGPGSKELMFLLQLVYYGDLVIPTPSWVSYAPQAQIIGRRVHWIPTTSESRWRLTPEQLEAYCAEDPDRPRIVVLNYPSNPTGQTYKADELREMARVARRYRVVLLSDEIYGELHYKGQHVSIARYYAEGTIISGGLSKWCGAGGWRLGTFLFPRSMRWLLDAMAAVASETYTATCAPVQYAAVRAFRGGSELEAYLWDARRILNGLAGWCLRTLEPTGVNVERPRGSFYLFLDASPLAERLRARGVKTSVKMCEQLLADTGVAILPGSAFGRPADELTARLAFVDFDGARALAAVQQVPRGTPLDGDFFETYCDCVVVAMQRLAEWLARPA